MKVLNTGTDYGDCDSSMKALHRWTLTITTITLSSAGQHWTGTPWFADAWHEFTVAGHDLLSFDAWIDKGDRHIIQPLTWAPLNVHDAEPGQDFLVEALTHRTFAVLPNMHSLSIIPRDYV